VVTIWSDYQSCRTGGIDLVYIDPPFNSNRNYEVFWGETKEKRAFEDPFWGIRNGLRVCGYAAFSSAAGTASLVSLDDGGTSLGVFTPIPSPATLGTLIRERVG